MARIYFDSQTLRHNIIAKIDHRDGNIVSPKPFYTNMKSKGMEDDGKVKSTLACDCIITPGGLGP